MVRIRRLGSLLLLVALTAPASKAWASESNANASPPRTLKAIAATGKAGPRKTPQLHVDGASSPEHADLSSLDAKPGNTHAALKLPKPKATLGAIPEMADHAPPKPHAMSAIARTANATSNPTRVTASTLPHGAIAPIRETPPGMIHLVSNTSRPAPHLAMQGAHALPAIHTPSHVPMLHTATPHPESHLNMTPRVPTYRRPLSGPGSLSWQHGFAGPHSPMGMGFRSSPSAGIPHDSSPRPSMAPWRGNSSFRGPR